MVSWPQLESLRPAKDQLEAALDSLDVDVLDSIAYDALGVTDWNLVAEQIISSGATAIHFIGEPGNFSLLNQKLKAQRWPGLVYSEYNLYDPLTLTSSGTDAADGAVITTPTELFSDPEPGSASEQMVDIVREFGPPDAKVAALTAQSFSSLLLFAEAAKECGRTNDGILTRECVIESGRQVDEWTGGGLHAPTRPSTGGTYACSRLLTVEGGEFVETHPETCFDPGCVEI